MAKNIPISVLRGIANKHGLQQVILMAWDGKKSHVVTYGVSEEDCDQAAQGGDFIKKAMNWPNWRHFPNRVRRLREALRPLANNEITPDAIDTARLILDENEDS